jgi:hypothetical protein
MLSWGLAWGGRYSLNRRTPWVPMAKPSVQVPAPTGGTFLRKVGVKVLLKRRVLAFITRRVSDIRLLVRL